jgi:hypothetical protein
MMEGYVLDREAPDRDGAFRPQGRDVIWAGCFV